MINIIHLLLFFLLCFLFQPSMGADSLAPGQVLSDRDNTTLVSANQTFELGFFSPVNSTTRYLGIWFQNDPERTAIWVANREQPVTDKTGILTISKDGNLVISSNRSGIIWSTNTSSRASSNLIVQILETGNLVIKHDTTSNGDENYLWQSFDYLSDTLIPGMKLGFEIQTNQEWYLTSWKSPRDPAPGEFRYGMELGGLPLLVLQQGSRILYRSGTWRGDIFVSGAPVLEDNKIFKPKVVSNTENVYYAFENNDFIISRCVVNPSGLVNHLTWNPTRNKWNEIARIIPDKCDNYGTCGNFGVCTENATRICDCLSGFQPRMRQNWAESNWSDGCVRTVPLTCSMKVEFRQISGVKLPDKVTVLNRTITSVHECEEICLKNCSCVAYAKTELSGCIAWFGDLLDIRTYPEGGQVFYVRMPASESGSSNSSKRTTLIASLSAVLLLLLLGLIAWYLFHKRAANKRRASEADIKQSIGDEQLELPLYDFDVISAATNKFSASNKIGEGGFGPVYKGVLPTGQEIAVKRLAKESGQGLEEFKNEVIFIVKLQHRNLVKLLGCCIFGEERVLIYEYMHNRSLDSFIFDQTKDTALDWQKRIDIIVGIARGLVYLHRDSRLRIIHRDLKLSNILLDGNMNPKISDFGLARTFGGDQYQDSTKTVAGTYGYMAPEYAIDGVYSEKSDVFSFGVLVIEIVSGNKNRGFYHPDHSLNLLGHAWNLWNEGKPLHLLDTLLENPKLDSEILRCIHVGLLCVQQHPEDRPTMSTVLLMLDSEYPVLAKPKKPGFYAERSFPDSDTSSTDKNTVSVTMIQGR